MAETHSVRSPHDLSRLSEAFAEVALQAGAAIMRVYGRPCAAWEKPDRSPVTEADEIAERIVLDALVRILPGTPVVAEEAVSCGARPAVADEFVLVDALDGTREFLKRNDEFTVNLALVRNGSPICGAVFAPALGRVWFAGEEAFGATVGCDGRIPPRADLCPLKARPRPPSGLVALASRSHADEQTEEFLASLPIGARRASGSSIKFCLLSEGEADVYARFGPTMEWDTAAGDAILRAAGGRVEDMAGRPLAYGKKDQGFRNCAFVAWGAPQARLQLEQA